MSAGGAMAMGEQLEFSIVTAVYNVAPYLEAFIDSIESQTYPRDRFEVIAVDDGSTDESPRILAAWAERRPGLVKVITKENGGQASARNVGLDHVRGRWVTFPDPDDVLRPEYLAEVAAFLAEHADAPPSMIATNRLILNDATGEVTNSHPLRRQFAHGNRTRNLLHYPEYFHGSAPAAFFPMAELRRLGLRFSTEVKPTWEDGHFCTHYLLAMDPPVVGLVATAQYLYRKRSDSSSTLQSSFADPARFTTVLERGFIEALEAGAAANGGRPPEWLQQFVIYELSWYYSSQETHAGLPTAAIGPIAEEFHRLAARVLSLLDPDIIAGFTIRPLKAAWVDLLLHAYRSQPWRQEYGYVSKLDEGQDLVRVSYRYTGPPPVEEVLSGGVPVEPRHAKVRDLVYYERALLHERILWVTARRSLRIRLDGRDLNLQFSVQRRQHVLRPGQIRQRLARRKPAAPAPRRRPPLGDRILRRLARSRPVRRWLRRSWVLMDRISDAGDSAERLFQHLRANRPEIKAWFVVSRDAPDWRRLRRRYGRRVVAHGSWFWKLLMANCEHLISSHIDVPIVKPPALAHIPTRWRFTFLQHGVIKDDLSAWLNPKPIDLFITSTPQEYASIAADHTPYVFTTKEVKLTGLPRFDRLLRMGERFADRRDLVLVAPTWRVRLVQPLRPGAHVREIDPAFTESEFARNWLGLLRSEELARTCAELGLTIGFLPHPVLQPALSLLDLPGYVRPLTFADNDVQELFARSAVMVTDYSSMAFNAAYINRPLVYFQFDHEEVRRGEHLGRRGYFDYERDGFGPVAYTLPDAVHAIIEQLRHGPSPQPRYQERIDAAFPLRDGRCCERVVAEIERLTQRLSAEEASVPVPTPQRGEPTAARTA